MRSVHGHHVDSQSQTEDDETDKDKEDTRPATNPNASLNMPAESATHDAPFQKSKGDICELLYAREPLNIHLELSRVLVDIFIKAAQELSTPKYAL